MSRVDKQAYLFLLPFLCAYSLFLVYPVVMGAWVSLHDWNLLEVALNPAAKEFVGFRNFERVLWGKDLVWSPWQNPMWQTGLAILSVLLAWRALNSPRSSLLFWLLAGTALFAAFVIGFGPGEDGRWYNRRFWPSVGNTFFLVAWIVPLSTAISLVLAVILNRETLTASIVRTVFFLSTVLSVTVVTLIWKLLLSPNLGMMTEILETIGLEPIAWATTLGYADAAIIMATVWWGIGIGMMLFLSALQGIPRDIYDAAKLDDIGPVTTFFRITLPNLRRAVVLVLVLGLISHFQIFGQVQLLTEGGPVNSTKSLVVLIYETAFQDNRVGRATAMALVLLVFIAFFSFLQLLVARERT